MSTGIEILAKAVQFAADQLQDLVSDLLPYCRNLVLLSKEKQPNKRTRRSSRRREKKKEDSTYDCTGLDPPSTTVEKRTKRRQGRKKTGPIGGSISTHHMNPASGVRDHTRQRRRTRPRSTRVERRSRTEKDEKAVNTAGNGQTSELCAVTGLPSKFVSTSIGVSSDDALSF